MRSPCPELALVALALVSTGCEREKRHFSDPAAVPPAEVVQSDLQPGTGTQRPSATFSYDHNAFAVSEGKRLYQWFNCVGCHAHGGGAIGPPLMDSEWIYGSEPQNIFQSIAQGRPNGMPSFGAHIPAQQVWQIVAYVRSMSGQVPIGAAPGRSDDLPPGEAEQSREPQTPQQTGGRAPDK